MKRIKTSCKGLLLTAILIVMSTSCAASNTGSAARDASVQPAEKHQAQVFAMDTVMMLTAYGENAEAALEEGKDKIYQLEADLDPRSADGSVYAVNAAAGAQVVVSRDCYNIMSTAMDVFYGTDGALDIGTYPLSKAWGFIDGNWRVPEPAEINGLLAAKNTGGIQLDGAACAVTIPAGMEISLGAAAKGYTSQALADLMAGMGVESAILSLGGNVQTLGQTKPDGTAWQVAVTDPRDTGAYVGILSVGQAAVVTSGGYQRFFQRDGVTYIHILDPETGYPVDNDLLSVTVVTEDGTLADALSTALFVMGRDGALAYYEKTGGFETVLITRDNTVIVTPGLAGKFAESGDEYTYEYYGYSE